MDHMILGGFALVWLLIVGIGIASTVFWIVELIDVIRRRFENDTMKVVWLLVVCLSHFIGAIVYYFVGKPMGRLPEQTTYR